jgi:hypothetical protein
MNTTPTQDPHAIEISVTAAKEVADAALAHYERLLAYCQERGYTPADKWHGTLGGYQNHKCRCAACKAAQATYMRAYRARR